MDKAAGMSIRKMWNYCIFQSSRYRGMKYIIVLGALSAASVSYINSFLYAGILDLLLAKQYSAAKEQILILVVTVVLVSLTARACELMFRHYTEPSALETKKKTAQKTFLMEYEELEKEAVIRAFQRVRRGINGHGGITQQLMDMYHFFTGMIQADFAAFFCWRLQLFFSWGIWRQTGLASWIWKKTEPMKPEIQKATICLVFPVRIVTSKISGCIP